MNSGTTATSLSHVVQIETELGDPIGASAFQAAARVRLIRFDKARALVIQIAKATDSG